MTAPANEQVDFDTEVREARKALTKAVYQKLNLIAEGGDGAELRDAAMAAAILKDGGFMKLPRRSRTPEPDGNDLGRAAADLGYTL